MFVLTYGDPAFQLKKTIHLLKKGSVQGIFLTKAKKGPFLEALIERNPFQDGGITYTEHSESRDGIQPARDQSAIVVIDDDPHQVASLEEIRSKLQLFSLATLRASHTEHKRFAVQTPTGEQVGEMNLESSSPDEQALDARVLKFKGILYGLESSLLYFCTQEFLTMNLSSHLNAIIRCRLEGFPAGYFNIFLQNSPECLKTYHVVLKYIKKITQIVHPTTNSPISTEEAVGQEIDRFYMHFLEQIGVMIAANRDRRAPAK